MDIANQPLLGKRNALREDFAQRLGLLFSFRYGYKLYAAIDEHRHGGARHAVLRAIDEGCRSTAGRDALVIELNDPGLHPLLAGNGHVREDAAGGRRCVARPVDGAQQEHGHGPAIDRGSRDST